MVTPYRGRGPDTDEDATPDFRASSDPPALRLLALVLCLFPLVAALFYIVPLDEESEQLVACALLVTRRVVLPLLCVGALVVPAAREFIALRRARRLAGWRD